MKTMVYFSLALLLLALTLSLANIGPANDGWLDCVRIAMSAVTAIGSMAMFVIFIDYLDEWDGGA